MSIQENLSSHSSSFEKEDREHVEDELFFQKNKTLKNTKNNEKTPEELEEESFTDSLQKRNNPLYGFIGELFTPCKAIRQYCKQCSASSIDISRCVNRSCFLYPYRFGTSPIARKFSPETLEKKAELLKEVRKNRIYKNKG